ncbi:MAG TPA: heme-dependent oxidative N-demethylase subunit alpha family protein [Prosthecobacter sp.]
MPDWFRLLPDAGHRLQMNLRPGDARAFWGPSPEVETVLAERRRWLAETPERYLCVLPEGEEAVCEAIGLMTPHPMTAGEAAVALEPDWIVLSGDAGRAHPVMGGAVIFPSGWALEDKMGKPLHEVHAPVPGLQSKLGGQISTFLNRLAPGAAWERDNWGLSADPSLNHHPAVGVRRLDSGATLKTVWLRLEQQFLARLPVTGAILFGIRVTSHRLDHLAAIPGLAGRLARALETMAGDVARYKGLDTARGSLIAELRA